MPSSTELYVITFANADGNLLGVAFDGVLALWQDDDLILTTSASRSGPEAVALSGPDVDLTIASLGDPSAMAPSGAEPAPDRPGPSPSSAQGVPEDPNGASERAWRVRGTVRTVEDELTIDAPGTELRFLLPDTRFDSLRIAVAWLGPAHVLSLVAVRPFRAGGHDRDVITAWERRGECVALSIDPRLSITALRDGVPLRLGLELWTESEDSETEYPQRAAGVVRGAAAELHGKQRHTQAHPVHWRAPAGQGPGLLLVGRPA